MTFMPKFKQPVAGASHQYHTNTESALLAERCRLGLSHLLANIDPAAPESVYRARLKAELQIIEEKSVCDYFLIVADYVQWAKDNDIATGPGRGSGPSSLVGFALGITRVDPIKYDLPFERFVNPERDLVPDFDLDFCGERFKDVTAYIQSKYGADRVAQICSDDGIPLPSRLVIGDRPLKELVPLSSNSAPGFLATTLTLAQIADAGLVQFNVINQQALTLIQRKVWELAKSKTVIDIDNIALNDNDTFRLLCAGEASNIVELDSVNYQTTLKAVRPTEFAHLCAVIAQCYAKFQDSLPLYVEAKQNPESMQFFHPALKSITAETYGVIIYQEQLMHITHKIAGFSMAQGDLFRRALKDFDNQAMPLYKKMFVDGAIERGMSTAEATDLFEYIALSGRNTFNKSHAVAFATIAYQTAWLKANYSNGV